MHMKVWELLSKDRLLTAFRSHDDGIECIYCEQIVNEPPLNRNGTLNENYPHKSSCFLIQDYDTAEAGTLRQSWQLFLLALKSAWKLIRHSMDDR